MSEKQTVIITGVSSFVGCHLAKAFARDWQVIAVIRKSQGDYEGIRAQRLAYIAEDVTFRTCDLSEDAAVRALVAEIKPALWIQHAGYAENYASPDYDLEKSFQVNVLALKPLYEALAEVGGDIILTGSNAEYGPNDKADLESDVCWPQTPYGLSKLAQTIEARRLSALYNVPTRVARLYIPVGPLDAPGKLIDHVITSLKQDKPVDLSPCLQARDFLSVMDVAEAYLKLAQDMKRTPFDLFNICSGQAVQLRDLLMNICEIMGKPASLLNFGAFPMRDGEAMFSFGANEKARTHLDGSPQDLKSILQVMIND